MEALLKKIESYGFECQGGPLHMCVHWRELRAELERLRAQEPVAWHDDEMDCAYTAVELDGGTAEGLTPLYRAAPPAQPAPAAVPPGYVLVLVNELADLRARAGFSDGWIVWPPCSVDQVAAAVAREREACAALCDRFAERDMSPAECAAAIRGAR